MSACGPHRLAGSAGFGIAHSSDHLLPWTRAQGQSGHAWSWLGAAMHATRFGAAISAETARAIAPHVDGLLTIARPHDQLVPVLDAFREAGGEGKPIYLKAQLAWAKTDDEALAGAFEQWRVHVLPSELLAELASVEQLESAARFVRPEDVAAPVRVSSDLSRHVAWIAEDAALGVDAIVLHQVPTPQRAFLDAFGEHVLPRLRAAR